jgi:hypothetical protein
MNDCPKSKRPENRFIRKNNDPANALKKTYETTDAAGCSETLKSH